MHYVIYGAGGVGSVLGAHLALAGQPVTLVGRDPHVRAITRGGLQIAGLRDATVRMSASSTFEGIEPESSTMLMLTMKSVDTEAALDALPRSFDHVPVVCCQNGVRNEELAMSRGLATYGAVVVVGAALDGPGQVAYTAPGHVHLGLVPLGIDALSRQVAGEIAASGLDGRVVPDVMAHKWGKLLRNLTNAYMALVGASIQETIETTEHRAFMADLMDEALLVLRAAGVAYEPEGGSFAWWIAQKAGGDPERGDGTVEAEIADLRRPGLRPRSAALSSYASTYQDLAAKRTRVEVDYFNGEILRLANQLGLSAPLNGIVLDRCRQVAEAQGGPGTETTATLRTAAR